MKNCELLLFHSTTKDGLKKIIKDGCLQPGMNGGWCDLEIKRIEREEAKVDKGRLIKEMEDYKEECKDFIFFGTDFHELEHEMPEGCNVILVVCLPKSMVLIPSRKVKRYIPFDEWDDVDGGEFRQVLVRDRIDIEYIVGCLEVIGERERFGNVGDVSFRVLRLDDDKTKVVDDKNIIVYIKS